MMQANELRIGNLFYKINRESAVHLPGTIPLKVLEINMFDVLACFSNENPVMMKAIPLIALSDLSPIPLTHDILEKCGFKKQMEWTYCIEIKDKLLVYYLGEKWWSIGNKNYSDFSNLKYPPPTPKPILCFML